MAKVGRVKVELYLVSLKSIVPAIPRNHEEKKLLVEDLTKMGCEGVLLEPWALKSKVMVQEFQWKRSNEWKNTMCRDPKHWTADSWAKVYGFRKEGRMEAGRTEK